MKQQPSEDIISYILKLRKIKDIPRFLNPSKDDLIPLNKFKHINKAVDIIQNGIAKKLNFYVHFDVDVDGISAGTIMVKYLQQMKANVTCGINQGKIHGISHYENDNFMLFQDADIIIIVDSLDNEYRAYDILASLGKEIVILDHHEFNVYPENAILISSSKNYPNHFLSGSGVVWKFCAYLDQVFKTKYSKDLIDLCATGILGDVCDVSEASYENRYLCHMGLSNIHNTGLKTIVGSYSFNSQSVIWSVAPLVNAAQRTNNNAIAMKLFLTDDLRLAKQLLKQLKEIKAEQDQQVAIYANNVELSIRLNDQTKDKFVYGFVDCAEYTGLIATKMAEKFQKPCIIFNTAKNYTMTYDNSDLKGSMRGFHDIDFRKIINSTNLARSMGHKSAAGITCKENDLDDLIVALNNKLKATKFVPVKNVDIRINLSDITNYFIEILSNINRISGKGFAPITVGIESVLVDNIITMQNKHTKFNSYEIDFIKWNNTVLYNELTSDVNYYKTVDIIGDLQLSNFAGRKSKQCIISDYKNICEYPDFLKE